MADLVLKASVREELGSAGVRRLRRNKEIPAVVYGKKKDPLNVKLSEIEIQKNVKSGFHENALVKINIDVKGKKVSRTVLIKEIQRHAITRRLVHIDFNEIALDEKIKAHVTVEPAGEPKGVKEQGGVLEHVMHEVEVECLPADIPEKIEVDVSELMIGDSIHIENLPVGDKVKILNDPELTVFAVAAPKVEEEPPPAEEGEEAQEPELVDQKGKKEEEGEEGAAAEGKEGKESKEEKKE